MPYTAIPISGVRASSRRGIAFLVSESDRKVDAKLYFDGIKKEKIKRDVLARFDYWLGGNTCDKYFHGWPNDANRRDCFACKWREGHSRHRLYGFLAHPRVFAPAFQVCVIVSHEEKNTEHTEPSEVDPMKAFMMNREVVNAVRKAYEIA